MRTVAGTQSEAGVKATGRVETLFDELAVHLARAAHDQILVDEVQDTDPLQAELLLLLAADNPGEHDWRRARAVPGKLFIVGDPIAPVRSPAFYNEQFRRAGTDAVFIGLEQAVRRMKALLTVSECA